ncbi:MAG: translation initiation factor IF-2 N-terminal domain-containing protein, partial [Planctomycetota bacterium]
MASTRVYILAKELGVKSSAIVKKCQDEGLDVKNHMSVIKAGLAATIKEWFSEGENITTVETSQKVDLTKVRVKKKKKKAKAKTEEAVATAVAEAEPDQAEQQTATQELEVALEPAVAAEESPPD